MKYTFIAVALTLAIPASASAQQAQAVLPSAAPPTADSVDTEWNSPALFWTGFGMSILGTASLVTGAAILASVEQPQPCRADPTSTDPVGETIALYLCDYGVGLGPSMQEAFGTAMTVHGALLLGAAIPLMIAGAWSVPLHQPRAGTVLPTIEVGAGNAKLSWSF